MSKFIELHIGSCVYGPYEAVNGVGGYRQSVLNALSVDAGYVDFEDMQSVAPISDRDYTLVEVENPEFVVDPNHPYTMSNTHPTIDRILTEWQAASVPPRPVQVLTCWRCYGTGSVDMPDGQTQMCTICGGRGRIATEGGEV